MAASRIRARTACLAIVSLAIAVVPWTHVAAASPAIAFAWGDNAYGQLGDGSLVAHHTPEQVEVLADASDVSGGREHVLALRSDGSVWAWGHNNYGQVGDGTTGNRLSPTQVVGLTNVVEVAAGHYHSLALRSDGTVWAWGLNASGQLGDGTTTVRHAPVQVGSLTGVIGIADGRDMSYALKSDGTVWAWGLNSDGELGDGTTTSRTTPVRVGALSDIVSVAAGRDHGLALDSNGAVWAWGDNAYGQLGDGSTTDRSTPVAVSGLSNATSISAGAFHSLALLSDGTVDAWGRNNLGQLGDGTTANRRIAGPVPGLADVASIGSGRDHAIAVLADGTARAWGQNDFGQLGDGTTTNRTSPVAVSGLTGALQASGGRGYSVALVSQGPPDTTPPTQPGKPSGQSTTPGTIDLSWGASTDDVSATLTYSVLRDGAVVGSTTSPSTTTVSFTDIGLAGGSTHTYVVVALDSAQNPSPPSDASDPITVAEALPPLFADDFSSADFSHWTTVTRLTIDGTSGDPSPPSARAQVSGLSASAKKSLTASAGSLCMSARVNATNRGTVSLVLIRLLTGGGGGIVRVLVNASGILVVRSDVSGARFSSATQLGPGWVSLELCGTVGAAAQWDLFRNGTKVVNAWTANTGTSPVGQVQIGDTAARTVTVNFDDVVVDRSPG